MHQHTLLFSFRVERENILSVKEHLQRQIPLRAVEPILQVEAQHIYVEIVCKLCLFREVNGRDFFVKLLPCFQFLNIVFYQLNVMTKTYIVSQPTSQVDMESCLFAPQSMKAIYIPVYTDCHILNLCNEEQSKSVLEE